MNVSLAIFLNKLDSLNLIKLNNFDLFISP